MPLLEGTGGGQGPTVTTAQNGSIEPAPPPVPDVAADFDASIVADAFGMPTLAPGVSPSDVAPQVTQPMMTGSYAMEHGIDPAPAPPSQPAETLQAAAEAVSPAPAPTGGGGGGAGGGGGGAGGGGGGAGGGGGGGAPAPQAGPADWEATIEQARQEAAAQQAALEEAYQADLAELQGYYQLAETDEERAQLRQILQNIKRQRDEGVAAISAGYEQTRQGVLESAVAQRGRSAEEADEVQARYQAAAEAISGDDAELMAQYADSGVGANLGGGPATNDMVADLARAAGAREATATERIANLSADDSEWLAQTLGGESEAQQAQLRREAQNLLALSELQHRQQVANRVNQERMALASAVQALMGDYRQRGFQLEDTQTGLLGELAGMQHQSAEAAADRAHDMAMLQRKLAAQRAAARSGGGSRGGGGGSSPVSQLEARNLALEALGNYGPDGAQWMLEGTGLPFPNELAQDAAQDALIGNVANDAMAGLESGGPIGALIGGVSSYLRNR